MQTFKATRVERGDAPASPRAGQWRMQGRRTPGRTVMVLQEGRCWVRRADGSREDLTAQSVVIWEPGEWVEYGGESAESYKIESYWAQDLSEDEWKAIFAEAFGPDAAG
jgi:hypothetical protein